MGKLVVGYGPSASGKSTAARAWWRESPQKRLVVEEGAVNPKFLKERVTPHLRGGGEVWMNILTSNNETTISLTLPGHTVTMRKFEHREG